MRVIDHVVFFVALVIAVPELSLLCHWFCETLRQQHFLCRKAQRAAVVAQNSSSLQQKRWKRHLAVKAFSAWPVVGYKGWDDTRHCGFLACAGESDFFFRNVLAAITATHRQIAMSTTNMVI